jgi:hypothetical protein
MRGTLFSFCGDAHAYADIAWVQSAKLAFPFVYRLLQKPSVITVNGAQHSLGDLASNVIHLEVAARQRSLHPDLGKEQELRP